MSRLVIILSPPRSFSSVVSTMIGEHPDLYGFPELHCFTADTMGGVVDHEHHRKPTHPAGPPGILRLVAQLHDGIQTTGTIIRAASWLREHRDWTPREFLDHILEQIAPQTGVEKSPVTATKPSFLERAYDAYPDAYFLHLTRHPVSNRASWTEFVEAKLKGDPADWRKRVDRLLGWYRMHQNILAFTNTLPAGQSLRLKGEDLLSEPGVYLPQIAEWLGIRTDAEAIEAMMHPETSPYAHPGPDLARGGNDPKFLRSPALRHKRVKEPSLAALLESGAVEWLPDQVRQAGESVGMQVRSGNEMGEAVARMAHELGYV